MTWDHSATTCVTCHWWKRTNRPGGTLGNCKRGAPTVVVRPDGRPAPAWPLVAADEWCGEHTGRAAA